VKDKRVLREHAQSPVETGTGVAEASGSSAPAAGGPAKDVEATPPAEPGVVLKKKEKKVSDRTSRLRRAGRSLRDTHVRVGAQEPEEPVRYCKKCKAVRRGEWPRVTLRFSHRLQPFC
jgi:hypothetical protein